MISFIFICLLQGNYDCHEKFSHDSLQIIATISTKNYKNAGMFCFPKLSVRLFSTKLYISRNKSYSILVLLTKYVCTEQYRDEDEALSKKSSLFYMICLLPTLLYVDNCLTTLTHKKIVTR